MATDLKYYKGQSLLDIELDTDYDVTTASVTKIVYKKPSGATGVWDAVQGSTVTKIKYAVQEGDIDEAGSWTFQAYIVVSDRDAHGTPVKIKFDDPIYQPV